MGQKSLLKKFLERLLGISFEVKPTCTCTHVEFLMSVSLEGFLLLTLIIDNFVTPVASDLCRGQIIFVEKF